MENKDKADSDTDELSLEEQLDNANGQIRDLQEYIKMDSFTLRINAITDELLTQDHTLNISTKFNISAKLLN